MIETLGIWGSLIMVLISLGLIILSADRFCDAASSAARNLKVPPLFIGLTIVSLGTSAPEILVSITAALEGATSIAIGNVLGSNIANIGLVLGVTAIFFPLPIYSRIIKIDLPLLMLALVLTFGFLYNLHLSFIDGLMLLAMLGFIGYFLLRKMRSSENDRQDLQILDHIPCMSLKKATIIFLVSLTVLLLSAEMLVLGASNIARIMAVPELIIGLTIVAIGTSLPELATTIGSTMKGNSDIAIGNVVGSNLINILFVLPIAALISPFSFPDDVIYRDYPVMILLTFILLLFAVFLSQKYISRIQGIILFSIWLIYNFSLLVF